MGCTAKVLEKKKENEGTVEGQTNKGGSSTDRNVVWSVEIRYRTRRVSRCHQDVGHVGRIRWEAHARPILSGIRAKNGLGLALEQDRGRSNSAKPLHNLG